MLWLIQIKRSCLIVFLLLTAVLQMGCSVAPWERGNLAKKQMLVVPNLNRTALRRHVFDSKEASIGGMGAAGGGCGCN